METPSQAPRRSPFAGYESASIGVILIAIAVAVLVAWLSGHWITFIPVLLIEVGMATLVLGLLMRSAEQTVKESLRNAMFFIFWGGTMTLIGVEWIAAGTLGLSGVVLFVIFILWVGVFALLLSLPKMRKAQ